MEKTNLHRKGILALLRKAKGRVRTGEGKGGKGDQFVEATSSQIIRWGIKVRCVNGTRNWGRGEDEVSVVLRSMEGGERENLLKDQNEGQKQRTRYQGREFHVRPACGSKERFAGGGEGEYKL